MKITEKQFQQIYKDVPILSTKEFIDYFKVLGDEIRHHICKDIFTHPGQTGKQILAKFKITQPTFSFHIKRLLKCGLISDKKNGREHHYYPRFEKILSFYKTDAMHHVELDNFLGKIYSHIIEVKVKTNKNKK